VLTILLVALRPDKIADMEKVYVDDDEGAGEAIPTPV
jgi:hypothetical protein